MAPQPPSRPPSVSGDNYNTKLSESRANAVRTYRVDQGVNGDSVVAKGFGKTSPAADNTTAAGASDSGIYECSVIREGATENTAVVSALPE